MVRTIRLYGRLKKKFGGSFKLDVKSPAEAIQALCLTLPGFQEEIEAGEWKFVRGNTQTGDPILERSLHLGLGNTREMHLLPATAAARGEGKIIIGILLIAASFIPGNPVSMYMRSAGISMVLSGLATMLTPIPPKAAAQNKDQSFSFSGADNIMAQGGPVPLIYGDTIVGSTVISAGLDVEQLTTSNYAGSGSVYYSGAGGAGTGFGGFSERKVASAKGGKSGGSSGQESPNTLRSNATAKLIDLLSEGPIVGLVDTTNPLKSVYFNDVQVQNSDGTFNFNGLKLDQRLGNPSDPALPGFSAAETETAVNTKVIVSTPVVRAVTDTSVDDVRVKVQIPALFIVNTKDGSIGPTDVNFTIDISNNGGTYTNVLNDTISGKTNSAYERAYRFELPRPGPWNIRMSRVTADSATTTLNNDINFESYTSISNAKLAYPNSAMIGISADAQQFGSQIPNRSYHVKGLIISVPANYDPVARTYATTGTGTTGGVWDGTFKQAWTNNPAWILYDILTNKRYGLGNDVDMATPNKWGLYALAQYCDGSVPNGSGGTEPRYTINTQITSRGDAWTLLQNIVSVFRGMYYWGAGTVEVTYDHNATAAKLVTKANVIGGKFNYSTDSYKGRHSVVIVTWNDPALNYRQNVEIIEDRDLISKMGYRQLETQAWGCTSRGQARRMGKWILDTEKYGELLTYKTGMDHADVRPGAIIEVNDPEYLTNRFGGRLTTGSTATVLQLDAPMTISTGGSVSVMLPDGTVGTSAVSTTAGTVSSLTLSTALAAVPLDGAVFSYAEPGITNRKFQIIAVTEPTLGEFDVSAIYFDPNKYARVESNLNLPPNTFSNINFTGQLVSPVTVNITDVVTQYGNATAPCALVSWTASTDPRTTFYRWQVKLSSSNDWGVFNRTTRTSEQFTGVTTANYDVRVQACNDGVAGFSAWTIKSGVALNGSGAALPGITGISVVTNNAAATTVLRWDPKLATEARQTSFEILYDPSSATIAGTTTSLGVTNNIEWPISRAGYYFVRYVFGYTTPGAATSIQVTTAMLPSTGSGISLSASGALSGGGGGQILFDSLADGTTYGKPLLARLNTGKPWIDFSEAIHANKSLANVDGTASTKLGGIATGATKNLTTYSATAPTSPTDGDLWVDITSMPYLYKMRVAGVWQVTSNYVTNTQHITDGAGLGNTALWSGVTGAGKAADNATVGADWTTNTANRPIYLTDGRVSSGLNSSGGIDFSAGFHTNKSLANVDPTASTKLGGIANGATYNKVNGAWVTATAYIVGDVVQQSGSSYSCILAHTSAAGNAPPNATYWTVFAQAGVIGTDAITAAISKEHISLQAYANGTVVSFANASGQWSVFSGVNNVTASATYGSTATGCTGSVNSSGAYSVTAMSAATATLSMTATYNGVTYTKVFSLTQDVFGYEIVGALPSTNLFDGRVVYLTTDKKLYRYNGTAAAWQTSVAATDISGTLADAQLAALSASKVTGQLTDTQLAAIAASKVTGQLSDTQLAAIAASKVTGQLADTQLAAIGAAKITGTITTTQITDGAIITAKISAGAVTSNSIAANTIVAANIAAGAITTATIAAGAVTAATIAANTITAGQIAASTITGTQIAASTITSGQIAANTIVAGNIAAGAITTATIAAGAVTAATIAANTITSGQIAANTITAGQIAANTITASQIAAGTITANEIAAGTITAAKMNVTQLSSITATIGTLRTASTGARVEISDNLIQVFDATRVRVKIGIF